MPPHPVHRGSFSVSSPSIKFKFIRFFFEVALDGCVAASFPLPPIFNHFWGIRVIPSDRSFLWRNDTSALRRWVAGQRCFLHFLEARRKAPGGGGGSLRAPPRCWHEPSRQWAPISRTGQAHWYPSSLAPLGFREREWHSLAPSPSPQLSSALVNPHAAPGLLVWQGWRGLAGGAERSA